MTDNNGNKKKKTEQSSNYLKTFRQGAIAANVFQRTAPGGFEYLDFTLSRAWKTAGGKEGYSQTFFSRNCAALQIVIEQACDFIEANSREASAEPAEVQTQAA
jgi:hypothetical protein